MNELDIKTRFANFFVTGYQKARWKKAEGKHLRKLIMDTPYYDFEGIDQKIWALKNDAITRPRCCVCDKPASYRQGKFIKTCGSHSCAKLNPEAKKKVANTNLAKYGAICPLQNETIKQKSLDTCIKNYGATHPMKNDDFCRNQIRNFKNKYGVSTAFNFPNVRIKASKMSKSDSAKTKKSASLKKTKSEKQFKQNLFSKYTLTKLPAYFENLREQQNIVPMFKAWEGSRAVYKWKHLTCNTEFESKRHHPSINTCPRCKPRSIPQEKVLTICESLGLKIIENDRRQISPYEIDLWLPQHNIGIEVNGIYWHNVSQPGPTLLSKTNLLKHRQLIHLWDFEIHLMAKVVESIIRSKTSKINEKIYARKCIIANIAKCEADLFFKENHISGKCRGDNFIGLVFNGILVMVASYSKSHNEVEILNFASKNNVIVVGGISKIASYLYKLHQLNVAAFCDRRFSNGGGLISSGFRKISDIPPKYSYFKSNVHLYEEDINQTDILSSYDGTLSESDFLIKNGWLKLLDCGHSKFVFCKHHGKKFH